MLTEEENREWLAQEDGRLEYLSLHILNGVTIYMASFNTHPFRPIEITKQQYEKYKPLCTFNPRYCNKYMPEWWSCAVYDNGLPKWFNKLFS